MATRGGRLVGHPPVPTSDGKRVLICSSNCIHVYSVVTGEQLLVLRGHTATVTAVVVEGLRLGSELVEGGAGAIEPCQAWSASLDGTIRQWDYLRGDLLKMVMVGYPIKSMVLPGLRNPHGLPALGREAYLSLLWKHGHEPKGPAVKLQKKAKQRKGAETAGMSGEEAMGKDGVVEEKAAEEEPGVSTTDGGGASDRSKKSRPVGTNKEGRRTGRVVRFDLVRGEMVLPFLARTNEAHHLVDSLRGGLVGTYDQHTILVWRTSDNKELRLHHTKAIRNIAFHPSETMVAAGDSSGRILAWYDVGALRDAGERTPSAAAHAPNKALRRRILREGRAGFEGRTNGQLIGSPRARGMGDTAFGKGGVRLGDDASALSTWHWHASAVGALAFSEDGVYVLSGGDEAVLVLWQVETGVKQFLPRLGAPIRHIVGMPEPTVFAVSCQDNAIRFVNIASMRVPQTIQGIKPPPAASPQKRIFASFAPIVEPAQGRLVLPAPNATLQMYDVRRDRQASEVQVAPRNFTVPPNQGNQIPVVSVSHVAFSSDASVLATIDAREPEENIGSGVCLKFWGREAGGSDYCVNTRMDDPHTAAVTALVFHPSSRMAVTASLDGDFKVWVQAPNTSARSASEPSVSWRCRSVGSYRAEPLRCACFTWDGSLLAVGAGETLTLWNTDSGGLMCALPPGLTPDQSITRVESAYGSQFLILTARGKGARPMLLAWNLLTMSVWWAYHLRVEEMAMDPRTSRFAVLLLDPEDRPTKVPGGRKQSVGRSRSRDRSGYVVAFEAHSLTPLVAWRLQKAVGATLVFLPPGTGASKARHSPLLIATRDRELVQVAIDKEEEEEMLAGSTGEEDATAAAPMDVDATEGPSGYEAMYGKLPSSKVPSKERVPGSSLGTRPWGDLFSGPSHVLPSLTRVMPAFMESMLQQRQEH